MTDFKDPDTLNLTKDQILERLEKIKSDVLSTNQGKLKKGKFLLVFTFLKWLVDHYDIAVLNTIFLGIIREFDEMRYDNALNSKDPMLEKLKVVKT